MENSSNITNGQFIEITTENTALLEQFLDCAGASLSSFRYFDKRPFSILEQHISTCLYCENDVPLCYGHLDKEADTVWLGIAVVEGQTGKGLGKKMMQYLVDTATKNELPFIQLSVDNQNVSAQRLYEKFGFETIKITDTYRLMRLNFTKKTR